MKQMIHLNLIVLDPPSKMPNFNYLPSTIELCNEELS